ncbi:MAG: hypothetical protein CGW95_13560 [Phenylobacterium zucineum]|nr:MAG: hypothetical protein CGW95_13560 [Phenylobacterium zucineum]
MTLEPLRRPEITSNVTRGAARLLSHLGYAALTEVTLPNGRRADLMALSGKGELLIVEVKSSVEDYRVDRKWPDYAPYCDRFAFAVAPEFPQDLLPEGPGLMVCDGFGGAVLREPKLETLAGARRKALLIGFARLAALRSAGVSALVLEA